MRMARIRSTGRSGRRSMRSRPTTSCRAAGSPTPRSADIDRAISHVTNQYAAQGVRAAQLDDAATTIESASIQLAEERSTLEDTDVASTVMKLNAKTLSLQAAQMAFAKVNRNTLFDFLS